mmetsp:Transcript_6744/g.12036  ORF Transcript_6744/g.12036 Transcript_6744/m.12036 type:complete len:235 (+) Transcript_6744:403-1107(+)
MNSLMRNVRMWSGIGTKTRFGFLSFELRVWKSFVSTSTHSFLNFSSRSLCCVIAGLRVFWTKIILLFQAPAKRNSIFAVQNLSSAAVTANAFRILSFVTWRRMGSLSRLKTMKARFFLLTFLINMHLPTKRLMLYRKTRPAWDLCLSSLRRLILFSKILTLPITHDSTDQPLITARSSGLFILHSNLCSFVCKDSSCIAFFCSIIAVLVRLVLSSFSSRILAFCSSNASLLSGR